MARPPPKAGSSASCQVLDDLAAAPGALHAFRATRSTRAEPLPATSARIARICKLTLLAMFASLAALADSSRLSKEAIKKMQDEAIRTICNAVRTAMKAARGRLPVVLAGCQNAPRGLVVDRDFLYWANERAGEIMRM